MTPLPSKQPYTRKPGSRIGTTTRRDIPMTSARYLMWLNKKRPLIVTPKDGE